ncbi:MAG: alpha/beta fold hydrolase [Actinomycetota bacterium]
MLLPSLRSRPSAPTHANKMQMALACVAALTLAACSSSSSTNSSTPTTTPAPITSDSAPSSTPAAAACSVKDPGTIAAAPVADAASDYNITSFDGTVIRAHWFPLPSLAAGKVAPTVLMGPGWGSGGDTNPDVVGILGQVNTATLRAAGYNVLTWDPRGFGKSTGTITIDDVDHEALDVSRLIDWVATQPQVELDQAGDPRMGMIGASYGGGIQLVTAATDCRVDAIVPVIAWHSLVTSLFKSDTPKTGWSGILSLVSTGRQLDPHIASANASSKETGTVSEADKAFFASRGPGDLISKIKIPTLLVQGTVDTLFSLDEAISNYALLKNSGAPSAMLWFCGGHGICLTKAGDVARVSDASIGWLDRYVKKDAAVNTGARFEFVDQDGISYVADDYPVAAGDPVKADGSGSLSLTADGGAGPVTNASTGSILDAVVPPITPTKATNAVNVKVVAPATTSIMIGAPELTMTYSGSTPDGARPTRVFAQLVDDTTGLVLGNQITPIAVTLDGQPHTVTVPLEVVAFTAHPGTSVTLQLVATTVAYAQPRLGGSIDFSAISISIPTGTGITAK